MIKKILNGQTKSITLASFILGVAYLGSAILGLLRDRLLASHFGAGDELDIYYAAFGIPDFVALLLIMGAVSAVVIPVFSEYFTRSKEEAWEFLSALLNLFLISLISVSIILVIFAPYLISLIAPGFSEEKKALAVELTRIMFLSPILLGISNIISGVLQVFHRFFVTALAPLMYNLGIICGILFFVPIIGIAGLAWGVVFGGFLHFLIQLPALISSGFHYKRISFLSHSSIPKTLKLMIPRSLGLAAGQINMLVIIRIASAVSGSIAIFNLANNLTSLLIGLVGISFSTAVFPSLSLAFSRKAKEEFSHKFSLAFRQILFLIIPLSCLFFILRAQIVRIVLGAGKFGWVDTRLTAACLGIFSFGLFAQALILLISKTFYATHNTRIPALVSVTTVILNACLSLLFAWLLSFQNIFYYFFESFLKLRGIEKISIVGLALAFSLSGIFQFFLLLIYLYKKLGDLNFGKVWLSFRKIAVATVLMAICVYSMLYLLAFLPFINTDTVIGLFLQAGFASFLSLLIYIIASFLLKSPELLIFLSSLERRFGNAKR